VITQREFLLAILLPAGLCVLRGMPGARLPEGGRRRALQSLGLWIAWPSDGSGS
jgi:hypothetical protein